ncbi:hypothetical protein CIAM_00900 [Citrobacter amalonaticus]|nr:hypothetical protein CIAM_00900 [Citrobacter amalonaticus]
MYVGAELLALNSEYNIGMRKPRAFRLRIQHLDTAAVMAGVTFVRKA